MGWIIAIVDAYLRFRRKKLAFVESVYMWMMVLMPYFFDDIVGIKRSLGLDFMKHGQCIICDTNDGLAKLAIYRAKLCGWYYDDIMCGIDRDVGFQYISAADSESPTYHELTIHWNELAYTRDDIRHVNPAFNEIVLA